MINRALLEDTVRGLLAPGRGILAADESLPTLGRRFAALGIPSTAETRRAYREMLFTAPGLSGWISGVILFDETTRQEMAGVPVPEGLRARGLIPGIKVDLGTTALPGFAGEQFTQGLDGLRERLAAYHGLGARFTKWRAVLSAEAGLPTPACIGTNARALALFAALSQEAGLVPIVEPEVLMDGDHTLARCEEVTGRVLDAVFAVLAEHRVVPELLLLKTGMVLPGPGCRVKADDRMVAEATLRCLCRSVPPGVPGIVFLSGGQADVEATRRLDALCRPGGTPWTLGFSYGRALQDAAMRAWHGLPANREAAQSVLLHRARCNGLAVLGGYSDLVEQEGGNTPHGADGPAGTA